ncbi:MAG: hypothetical protein IPK82_34305 [Polyangiaceae bacterium]|nr:hypothetical protein [Polyangiaceae bacterium]
MKKWGLLSAELVRPDGSSPSAAQMADFQNVQTAVLPAYGSIGPTTGPTFAGLSTGRMRSQSMPDYVPPVPGTDLGWAGSPPSSYLATHSGALPSSSGCSGICPSGVGANDGVSLRLSIRTPTNAVGQAFVFRFLTAEYPANLCSTSNDFSLGLLASGAQGLPADKNIIFDGQGNPLSVNNAWFDVCSPSGCMGCPSGDAGLTGTGMGAATQWLPTSAPVVGGEVIVLELMLFDVTTHTGDSVALVDGFHWGFYYPTWWDD